MSKFKYIRNVVTLQLNEKRCIGCEMCANVCPRAVFQMEGRKAAIVQRDGCMECGACAKNCPTMAISVHAGVACVTAIIKAAIRGTEPNCDCAGKPSGNTTGSRQAAVAGAPWR
jgi:NAD-dependent dihydropyrimidine dehydrogenase PreA subunit